MNVNPVMPHNSPWLALGQRNRLKVNEQANSLTTTGVWLLLIGAMVVMSGLAEFRIHVGSLRLQPYLIPIGLAFPFVALFRISKFPQSVLLALIVFAGIYGFVSIGPATLFMNPLAENVKLLSAIMAIFTVALLVRSRADFVFGAAGLALAVGLLACAAWRTRPS